VDFDAGLSVYGKQEFPLPASVPYKESHLDQDTTSDESSGSGIVHLETSTDGIQLSRDAILGFQTSNKAEPLNKLLDTSRRTSCDKDTLGATPYRYKLSELENTANLTKEQSQDPPLSPWYPVFQWEKRLAKQIQMKDSFSNRGRSDPESDTDSCDTTRRGAFVRLESDSSVIVPGVDPDNTDIMKDQGEYVTCNV
jgi:hypothetical protein